MNYENETAIFLWKKLENLMQQSGIGMMVIDPVCGPCTVKYIDFKNLKELLSTNKLDYFLKINDVSRSDYEEWLNYEKENNGTMLCGAIKANGDRCKSFVGNARDVHDYIELKNKCCRYHS